MNENENKTTPAIKVEELRVMNQNNSNNASHQATDAGKEHQANADANNLEFGEEIRKMLGTAGTLQLSPDQNEALYDPIRPNEISIKPDGLIYLSWIKYAGRLTKAFSGTGWAMIPQGMPKMNGNLIIWGFHLVIKGVYCGFAIGEQQYHDSNKRMTFGEACEGAKSNALMRLCKALGIGLELWDKEFINEWLDTYASKTWDERAKDGKGAYFWSLKPNAFASVKANAAKPAQKTTVANTENKTAEPATEKKETEETAPAIVVNPVSDPVNTNQPNKTAPVKSKDSDNATKVAAINTAPVNAEVKEGSKQATGKAKNSKLSENADFLKENKKETGSTKVTAKETVKVTAKETTKPGKKEPVKPVILVENISEAEIAGKSKFDSFNEQMDKVDSIDTLKDLYNVTIRKSLTDGEITEEQKETLRQKANGLFVKLSAAKGK